MKRRYTMLTIDILMLSLGTTLGLRHGDATLAAGLRDAGASCELVQVEIGPSGRMRKGMVMTDMVEAVAARATLKGALQRVEPRAIVFNTTTTALVQASGVWPRYRTAIRFDSPASLNRPGRSNLLQHALERRSFKKASLLVPLGRNAASHCGSDNYVIVPAPVDMKDLGLQREKLALAYAANPKKRGLDILCQAWADVQKEGFKLMVTGIERERALNWLAERGVQVPPGIEWAGQLPRQQFEDKLQRAKLLINASRWEDYGLAQLEALSSGAALVTSVSGGADESLRLARELDSGLVADGHSVTSLASAISKGISYSDEEAASYRQRATRALAPFRPAEVQATIERELLPRLLG